MTVPRQAAPPDQPRPGDPDPVIDLGLLPAGRHPAPGAARRAYRGGGPRRRWRQRPGWLPPALVAALALSLLAGAAPVSITSVATVRLPDPGRFDVLAGHLLVADTSLRWTAHDLRTGEPRYRVPVRGPGSSPVLAAGLFIEGGTPVAIDPETGRQRWPQPPGGLVDNPLLVLPGVAYGLRVGDRRRLAGPLAGGTLARELTGVDLRTGEVIWHHSLPRGATAWLVGEPPVVVTLSGDGLLETRDPATGRLAASRQITVPGRGTPELGPLLVSERLVFWYPGQPPGTIVNAYIVDDLAPAWERVAPHPTWLEQCGRMLCLHTQPPPGPPAGLSEVDPVTGHPGPATRVSVIDPITGQTGWRAEPGVHHVQPVGERLLRYGADGLPLAVVDPASGVELRDLRGWRTRELRAPGGRLALVRDAGQAGDRSRAPVAVLDLATLALTELPWVTGSPDRCIRFDGGLVCRYDRLLRVWTWRE